MEADVVVIGGGIAGLSCATELAEQGLEVRVLEAAPRVGGPVETRRDGELVIERGPQTVRSTPELERMFVRAGLEPVYAERRSPYVLRDERLVKMPPSPSEIMSGALLPPLALLTGILGEPFRRRTRGPRSVRRFVEERLGPKVADAFADLLTLGVYAQPADQIGFESAYPELAEDLDRYGSLFAVAMARLLRRRSKSGTRGMVSAEAGLGHLVDGLGRTLGDRLRLNTTATRVERVGPTFRVLAESDGEKTISARHVVLAIAPQQAARLVTDSNAAPFLARTRTEPQTLAHFALKDPEAVDRWRALGFLVPSHEGIPIVGCLFPSSLFGDRAPADVLLITLYVAPSLRDEPDAVLARELGPLCARLLRTSRSPELVDVARHPVGIPVYDRRHYHRTRAARHELANERGPLLAGAGFDGVGFGSAASSGIATAREILDGTQ
jgi:oxygen-dependent protoporphyrinogen oxidase